LYYNKANSNLYSSYLCFAIRKSGLFMLNTIIFHLQCTQREVVANAGNDCRQFEKKSNDRLAHTCTATGIS